MAEAELLALRIALEAIRAHTALVAETASIKRELEEIQIDIAQLQRKMLSESESQRRKKHAEELAQKRREQEEALRKLEEEKRRKREEDFKRKEEERKAEEKAKEEERKRIQEQPLNVPQYGLQQTFASVAAINVIYLPPDLWVNILSSFSSAHLLRVVALLSKTFKYGVSTDSLWRKKFAADFPLQARDMPQEERESGNWFQKYRALYVQHYGSLAIEIEPINESKWRGFKLTVTNKSDQALYLQPLALKFLCNIYGGVEINYSQWRDIRTGVIFLKMNKELIKIEPRGELKESFSLEAKVGGVRQHNYWGVFLRNVKDKDAKDAQFVDAEKHANKLWQYRFCVMHAPEKLAFKADPKKPLPVWNAFQLFISPSIIFPIKGRVFSRVLILKTESVSAPFKPATALEYVDPTTARTSLDYESFAYDCVRPPPKPLLGRGYREQAM